MSNDMFFLVPSTPAVNSFVVGKILQACLSTMTEYGIPNIAAHDSAELGLRKTCHY